MPPKNIFLPVLKMCTILKCPQFIFEFEHSFHVKTFGIQKHCTFHPNYYMQVTVFLLIFHYTIPSNTCNTPWRIHQPKSLEDIYVWELVKYKVTKSWSCLQQDIFPLQIIATSLETTIAVQLRVFLFKHIGCKQIDSI